jgi:hypothetical protein
MGLPRVDVVLCLWQCDKKNHGWREGPPLTVLCQSVDLLGWAFTLRQSQFRTRKEYCFAEVAASPSTRTLAGIKGLATRDTQNRTFLRLARDPLGPVNAIRLHRSLWESSATSVLPTLETVRR